MISFLFFGFCLLGVGAHKLAPGFPATLLTDVSCTTVEGCSDFVRDCAKIGQEAECADGKCRCKGEVSPERLNAKLLNPTCKAEADCDEMKEFCHIAEDVPECRKGVCACKKSVEDPKPGGRKRRSTNPRCKTDAECIKQMPCAVVNNATVAQCLKNVCMCDYPPSTTTALPDSTTAAARKRRAADAEANGALAGGKVQICQNDVECLEICRARNPLSFKGTCSKNGTACECEAKDFCKDEADCLQKCRERDPATIKAQCVEDHAKCLCTLKEGPKLEVTAAGSRKRIERELIVSALADTWKPKICRTDADCLKLCKKDKPLSIGGTCSEDRTQCECETEPYCTDDDDCLTKCKADNPLVQIGWCIDDHTVCACRMSTDPPLYLSASGIVKREKRELQTSSTLGPFQLCENNTDCLQLCKDDDPKKETIRASCVFAGMVCNCRYADNSEKQLTSWANPRPTEPLPEGKICHDGDQGYLDCSTICYAHDDETLAWECRANGTQCYCRNCAGEKIFTAENRTKREVRESNPIIFPAEENERICENDKQCLAVCRKDHPKASDARCRVNGTECICLFSTGTPKYLTLTSSRQKRDLKAVATNGGKSKLCKNDAGCLVMCKIQNPLSFKGKCTAHGTKCECEAKDFCKHDDHCFRKCKLRNLAAVKGQCVDDNAKCLCSLEKGLKLELTAAGSERRLKRDLGAVHFVSVGTSKSHVCEADADCEQPCLKFKTEWKAEKFEFSCKNAVCHCSGNRGEFDFSSEVESSQSNFDSIVQ